MKVTIYDQAPDGHVFVCAACGKLSMNIAGTLAINRGWDESCAINCVLARLDHLVIEEGRVRTVRDGGVVGRGMDTLPRGEGE